METIFLAEQAKGGRGSTEGEKNNIQTISGHPKNGKAAIGKAIFAQAPSLVQTRPELSYQQLDCYSGWPPATGDNKKWRRQVNEKGVDWLGLPRNEWRNAQQSGKSHNQNENADQE